MSDEEDYYKILGIDPSADTNQIKEAYLYKVNILHPDRLGAMPERIRNSAEEELKRVNKAYSVLSDLKKKREYDIRYFGSIEAVSNLQKTKPAGKPRVEVYPSTVHIKDALPYIKKKATFFVRNTGGPYSKVLLSKTPEWLKIAQTKPLQASSKLPMQVELEAVGVQWGKVYTTQIAVRLDESEKIVKVELKMQKKPHR